MKAVLEIGKKYGRLTIIEYNGKAKSGCTLVRCKCDCGNEKTVRLCSLKKGEIKSCGCLAKELLIKRNKTIKYTTHGHSRTRLYLIWVDMKQRCFNKKQTVYKHYGGRGIIVCEEWQHNFQAFYDWAMKNGYSDELTIDRIDNNGNYEPSNCRWATMKEQRRNTRQNIVVEINGVKRVLLDWCKQYKIKYTTVLGRINKGWDRIKAITTPSKKYGGKPI